MICPGCQREVKSDYTYCPNCGRPASKGGVVHPPSGNITTGDVGMIKDSKFHSEVHQDSHEVHQDSHNVHHDSHNVTGAPAVGGSQTLNFTIGSKEEATVTKTGERCPICRCLAKDDYFYCESCEKDFICLRHQNRQNFLCHKCSPEVVTQHQNRTGDADEKIRLEDERIRLEKKRQSDEEEEGVFWQGCQKEDTLESYRRYLNRYPHGRYVSQVVTAIGGKQAEFELAQKQQGSQKKEESRRAEEERQRIEAAKSRKRVRTMVASLVVAVLIVAIGYAGLTLISKDKPTASTGAGQSGVEPAMDQTTGQGDVQKKKVQEAAPTKAEIKPVQATTPALKTSDRPQTAVPSVPVTAKNLQQKAQTKPVPPATPAPETSVQPPKVAPPVPMPAANLQQKDEALEISVNIIGQREAAGRYEPITVKNDGVLRTNDNLKIYVKPSRDAYIYVLVFDSVGKADMLFPSAQISMNNHVRGGQTYPVPEGGQWFYLDENTGTENVYVMASLTPMADIDKLLAAMESKGQRQQQDDSKKILAQMNVLKRGVRGIKTGPSQTYKTSVETDIKSVTQIVEGLGSVVWSLSFKHI